MIKRNIAAVFVVLCVVGLHLTSGRHIKNVVNDDVNSQLSFEDKPSFPAKAFDSLAMNNTSDPLDHPKLTRERRKAINDPSKLWTQKEIPFEIDYSQFTDEEIYVIFQAMDEWQQNTCLTFRPTREQDKNIVNFINGKGCKSNIGMTGGVQNISLGKDFPSCVTGQTVIHEIGHAVGFFHEHSRPDRDQFVTILTNNIKYGMEYNFFKSYLIDTYGLKYDYRSIMHYFGTAFGKNHQIYH